MQKMIPRLLISAVGSGTGKTTVTAALLSAFCARGMRVQSLKCGPDYIDPMFHSHITGRPAYHADPFFLSRFAMRELVSRVSADADCTIFEGAMGYYDGIGGTEQASAYTVSDWLAAGGKSPRYGLFHSGSVPRIPDVPDTEPDLRHFAERGSPRHGCLLSGDFGTGNRLAGAGLSAAAFGGAAGKPSPWADDSGRGVPTGRKSPASGKDCGRNHAAGSDSGTRTQGTAAAGSAAAVKAAAVIPAGYRTGSGILLLLCGKSGTAGALWCRIGAVFAAGRCSPAGKSGRLVFRRWLSGIVPAPA